MGIIAAALVARTALPELRQGMEALRHAHRQWLALALALQGAALATLPLTFRAALEQLGGRVTYTTALDATLGAFALSRVVPGGGLAGGVYATQRFARAGNSATMSGTAVATAGVATMLSLGLVVVGGAAVEAATGRVSAGMTWAMAGMPGAAAAGGVALAAVLRRPERLEKLSARLGPLIRRPVAVDAVRRQLDAIAPQLSRPRTLARVAGWSALNWALQLAALWTIFLAFGVSMPVGVLILGFGAANLVTALPHTPGGLGVVEAGMTATYVALGVPVETALVGVLCYRLLGHWLPVLLALPVVLPQIRHGRRERRS